MLYYVIHYITIFKHNGTFFYKPLISIYEDIISFVIAKIYYDFEINIFEMKNAAHIAMILNNFIYFYYNDWYKQSVNNAGGCWCNFGMFIELLIRINTWLHNTYWFL